MKPIAEMTHTEIALELLATQGQLTDADYAALGRLLKRRALSTARSFQTHIGPQLVLAAVRQVLQEKKERGQMNYRDEEIFEEIDRALGYAEQDEWNRFWFSTGLITAMTGFRDFTSPLFDASHDGTQRGNRELAIETLRLLRTAPWIEKPDVV